MKIANNIPVREVEENYINIQPIQAAGRLTGDAMKALIAYGDGYSTCDQCRKPFRLDKITKPNIAEFHNDLAEFLHMEEARVTPGARRAFQAVCLALAEKGDTILVSALAHYTEFLAVENANAVVKEIPVNEKNVVTGDVVAQKIEDVTREQGKKPALVMLDHFDYSFANEHDIVGAARAAHQYDVPILYNGAYTVGIKPVDGKGLGVDFVVGSGHKSMASPAPSGVTGDHERVCGSGFPDDADDRRRYRAQVWHQGGRNARLHAYGGEHHCDDGVVSDYPEACQ